MKATKDIRRALYDAYLIAQSAALAHVYRVNIAGEGDARFFASSTEPELIGLDDAYTRIPKGKRGLIASVDHVSSIAASAVAHRAAVRQRTVVA